MDKNYTYNSPLSFYSIKKKLNFILECHYFFRSLCSKTKNFYFSYSIFKLLAFRFLWQMGVATVKGITIWKRRKMNKYFCIYDSVFVLKFACRFTNLLFWKSILCISWRIFLKYKENNNKVKAFEFYVSRVVCYR